MSNAIDAITGNPVIKTAAIYAGGGLVVLLAARYVLPKAFEWIAGMLGNAAKEAGAAAARTVGAVGNAVLNPVNQQNIWSETVRNVGVGASGDKQFTLGGYVYDMFHEPYDPNKLPAGSALANLQRRLPSDPKYRPQILK